MAAFVLTLGLTLYSAAAVVICGPPLVELAATCRRPGYVARHRYV